MFWYEEDVKQLEKKLRYTPVKPETIFYGSSSIRLWNTLEDDFDEFNPINLGFGGSTLAACVWFFERIMQPCKPRRLVVYAGDNDLGDGRHPEEVFIFFQQLVSKANKLFGDIPCYYISLKPSPQRWNMAEQFRYTNNLIRSEIIKADDNWHYIDIFSRMLNNGGRPDDKYYVQDKLHLSPAGYQVWKEAVKQSLNQHH